MPPQASSPIVFCAAGSRVSDFLVQVALQGPWFLLVTAFLETSFVTGLLVPAGAALPFATAFALGQGSSLPAIPTAALAVGAVGDSVGFWIGRKGRDGVGGSGGRRWIRGARPVHPVASAEEMRW